MCVCLCVFAAVNKIHNFNAYMEAVCLCIDLFLFPLLTIVYTKNELLSVLYKGTVNCFIFCCIWFYLFCSLLPQKCGVNINRLCLLHFFCSVDSVFHCLKKKMQLFSINNSSITFNCICFFCIFKLFLISINCISLLLLYCVTIANC